MTECSEKIQVDALEETNVEKVASDTKADLAEDNQDAAPGPTSSENTVDYDLKKFRLQRILNNNTRNKIVALLGKFPDISDNDQAIVIFEKQAFEESDVATNETLYHQKNGKDNGSQEESSEKNGTDNSGQEDDSGKNCKDDGSQEENSEKPTYFCSDLEVQTQFVNNIYGSYRCTPPAKLSGVKATVVYPATDKHVEKYSICQKFVINETPKLYEEITLPYITSSQFSLEWVYNILEHKQESERIIFEDPDPENGFILLPDLKWDGHNVENLYVLAITHKRDIKSLRDLNASHLPLLRNIRTCATEAIESRYGMLSTQLRMYIHYQPSFYHLHVHINPVRNEAPGIWCEKSHMLDTVINNLELLPDYYKEATLPFVLFDGNKLLELYETKLNVRKSIKRKADQDSDDEVKNDIADINDKPLPVTD